MSERLFLQIELSPFSPVCRSLLATNFFRALQFLPAVLY